jgi:hypothetical protein
MTSKKMDWSILRQEERNYRGIFLGIDDGNYDYSLYGPKGI